MIQIERLTFLNKMSELNDIWDKTKCTGKIVNSEAINPPSRKILSMIIWK